MNDLSSEIRPYRSGDREGLIQLWRRALPDDSPHNEPNWVIAAKLAVDHLLFVASETERIVGSEMAGYDGHRGWVDSVAVQPVRRRRDLGRALVNRSVGARQSA